MAVTMVIEPSINFVGALHLSNYGAYGVEPTSASYDVGLTGFPFFYKEVRLYAQFATNNLPPGTVTKTEVEWKVNNYTDNTSGGVSQWAVDFALGTWMGSSLDVSDWGGGTSLNAYNYASWPSGLWTLQMFPAATANSLVNLSGPTDLEIKDFSTWGGPSLEHYQVMAATAVHPQLIVTMDVDAHPNAVIWTP